MKKWYSGRELLLRWNCTPTELLSYLRKGLPAYDDLIDRRILDVDTLRRRAEKHSKKTLAPNEITDEEYLNSHLYLEDGEDSNTGVMNFNLPSNKDEARNLFKKIKEDRFKQQDVIEFEKKHNINPTTELFSECDIAPAQLDDVVGALTTATEIRSRSSEDRKKAIALAKVHAKNKDQFRHEVAKIIHSQPPFHNYKLDTIKNWIKNEFTKDARKPGRPKKINTLKV